MSNKVIRADGIGYHNAIPEIVEQTILIKRTIETKPKDEAGHPLPPRVTVHVEPSSNISPGEAIVACTQAINEAVVAISQMEQQRTAQFEQAMRAKRGGLKVVQ